MDHNEESILVSGYPDVLVGINLQYQSLVSVFIKEFALSIFFYSSTFSDTSLLGENLLGLFVMRRNLTCAQVWLAILKIIGIPNVLSCVLLNLGQGA